MAGAETASASIEQFGYKQELKRALSLFDLTVYGLVYINIVAAFTTFGIVYNASRGMVPLVYVVGLIAMTFTALSYMTMSRAFPIAGSVYSYAGRGIGESAGFLAGWALLLDYILAPALLYVVTAVAIQAVVPQVPRAVWIIMLLAFNTAITLLGIEMTARMNRLIMFVMFATAGLFIAMAVFAASNGVSGSQFSTAPFFNSSEFSPNVIFGALSIAVLAFTGFDAISTLAEETRGGPSMVGRATLLSLLLGGAFFIVESYLASLFVLDRASFSPGQQTDGAIYIIAALIGGPVLQLFLVSSKVLVNSIGVAAVQLTATARLVFSMARDGKLPRALAHVHSKRKVPDRAILLVAAINLVVAVTLANQLALLASMLNFGALTGFLMLHASVIVHFMWRQKSKHWIRHLLSPLIGSAFIAYVLVNMAVQAKIAGIAWLAVGVVALIGLKLGGRRAVLPA